MIKFRLFIGLFISLFLSGCTTFNNAIETSNATDSIEKVSSDNDFNLNINALSYQLPFYTKICVPETRFDCSISGCKVNKPVVFVLYNEITNKIYRCDKNPCDEYSVAKNISGLYTNLTPINPNGSLVKLSDDNHYVETVSSGLDFIISRGVCNNNFIGPE